MATRNIDSSVLRRAQERIAAARLWIRMLLIIGFVVEFFSNLLGWHRPLDPDTPNNRLRRSNQRTVSSRKAKSPRIYSFPNHENRSPPHRRKALLLRGQSPHHLTHLRFAVLTGLISVILQLHHDPWPRFPRVADVERWVFVGGPTKGSWSCLSPIIVAVELALTALLEVFAVVFYQCERLSEPA